MTRMNLVAIAALAGAFFGLQPAQAYEAPWCAAIEVAKGSVYWDCQYRSFEDCYRRGIVVAGNRGFCNHSRTTSPTPQNTRAQRNAAHARSSGSMPVWTRASDTGKSAGFSPSRI